MAGQRGPMQGTRRHPTTPTSQELEETQIRVAGTEAVKTPASYRGWRRRSLTSAGAGVALEEAPTTQGHWKTQVEGRRVRSNTSEGSNARARAPAEHQQARRKGRPTLGRHHRMHTKKPHLEAMAAARKEKSAVAGTARTARHQQRSTPSPIPGPAPSAERMPAAGQTDLTRRRGKAEAPCRRQELAAAGGREVRRGLGCTRPPGTCWRRARLAEGGRQGSRSLTRRPAEQCVKIGRAHV